MRRTRHHTLILALALSGWVASTAGADPITPTIIDYSTDGSVGGPSGGPVHFEGTDGSFITPGTFVLGQFETPVLPSSATLTYTNTPFNIDVSFSTPSGPASDLIISGLINGTITGNTSSSMVATITSVVQGSESGQLPFPLNTFQVLAPQILAPRGMQGGITNLYAYSSFNAAAETLVPEPSTFALFGTVLVGFGVRRWRRAGR